MGFCHKDVWVCGAARRSCLVISVFSDTKWPIPAKARARLEQRVPGRGKLHLGGELL